MVSTGPGYGQYQAVSLEIHKPPLLEEARQAALELELHKGCSNAVA